MGSLDQIAKQRQGAKSVASSGGGTLDQIAHARGSSSPDAIQDPTGSGIPTVGTVKPPKKRGGFWHEVARDTGAEFTGNLLSDVGTTAVGILPGLYDVGKNIVMSPYQDIRHGPSSPQARKARANVDAIPAAVAKQYKSYYGHDIAHHLYTHPLQPILDALTVVSGGAGAAAKVGKVAADAGVISDTSRLAKLGERATVKTRSPRAIATGRGPAHTDITSTQPLVKGREVLAAKVRAARPEGIAGVGGEVKRFGKQIQAHATQHALGHLNDYAPYLKATKGLSQREWAALHIRAMDIHPHDLQILWKGTPAETFASDAKVTKLVEQPTAKLAAAEQEARRLSLAGEKLLRDRKLLTDETAGARPSLTKRQASATLGRDVKEIHGNPYYLPHVLEDAPKPVNPLSASGGGKGVPRAPGATKQNLGVLALQGKLHLRGDVLGPEFLRRVKFVKFDEIHNALVRGAVRVTKAELDQHYGGKLPNGYEFVRTKPSTIEKTVSAEPDPNQLLIPGTAGATKTVAQRVGGEKITPTMRGETTQHVPIEKLIPNAEDLHDSELAKQGFSTTDPQVAHRAGGRYYIVPKTMVKAATGEFTRSSDFTHNFVKRPLSVWRSAVLGLRPGFFTNNLVGNSIMYGVKTGGRGAIRDLFAAIRDEHGNAVAQKALDTPGTPPELRRSLYKEFFPEQMQGTFGRTQSPAASRLQNATGAAAKGWQATTGAIPKVTSAVAETAFRKGLIHHYIRHSPEFKQVYGQLPKQTRSFEQAARHVLAGKGGPQYQRFVSKQVNQALGDYLNLSAVERNVLRNAVPFYSWYRAITTTTAHLAADTPLRANILGQIGQIGKQWSDKQLGEVPSFLEGAIPFGHGKGGTQRVLATQGLNPYATLQQLGRAGTGDVTALGINPFLQGLLDTYAKKSQHGGKVGPAQAAAATLQAMFASLPPSQVVKPLPPSKLYPNRDRRSTFYGFLGAPVKEYSPLVAAAQKRQGR